MRTFNEHSQLGSGPCNSGSILIGFFNGRPKRIRTQSIIRRIRRGGRPSLRTTEISAGVIVNRASSAA
jgi:hypothetical protein